MASATESSLISKLEVSNSAGLYPLISHYLHPFADLNKTIGAQKSTKNNEHRTQIRSLATKFLHFLNRSLSILPKRIPEVSKSDGGENLVSELVEVYRLCLSCLNVVASQLDGKPYLVDLQRCRLMHCLEACGRYEEAEDEGFSVLEHLRLIDSGSKSVKLKGPEVDKVGGDKEFVRLAVEIVVTLVKCAAMGQKEDNEGYKRLIGLLEEVPYWLRLLDANAHEKLHKALVVYLGKCTLALAGKKALLDRDLFKKFCSVTLAEYKKSSLKDQFYKIAQSMCSTLFKLRENKSLYIIDILDYICKIEEENIGTEFVELVSYCANKCQTANVNFCGTFADDLNKLSKHFQQVMTPLMNLILRFYATGLLLINCNLRSGAGDLASSGGVKFESLLGTLLGNEDTLQDVFSVLGPLCGHLHIGNKMNQMSSDDENKDIFGQICMQLGYDREASMAYLPFYLNALKFVCQPLAESINSERKQLFAEKDGASAMTMLPIVQDTFHQLCHLILSCPSFTSEKNGNGFDENCRTVLSVAVAAFTLSVKTKINYQRSAQLVKHIIDSEWIQAAGLKYIIACLYNIGVTLYRNKQAKEASKVLNLWCKASWLCIKCHSDDLSEGAFIEYVFETSKTTAFFLDILYQVDSHKVRKKIIEILKNWSTAKDMFERLPAPMPVVKQLVKIECKCNEHVDEIDDSQISCSLLSTIDLSKRNIGIILEQELAAYEEMSFSYPEFCQEMQIKITDILLRDVYVTPDSCFQRAQTLVRKGKTLRICGIDGLKDCIHCFSEAITMIKQISGGTYTNIDALRYQLFVAYCLRALCSQEAETNSEQIFGDVKAALNIWMSFSIPDCCEKGGCSAMSENIMILLYNIIDLLQLKGSMELQNDVYQLVIRVFKMMNVSIETWLPLLWGCRRINHALCVSPVNEPFIMNLSENFSEHANIDFWIHYLKDSQPLSLGFQQSFSFLFASSHMSSCNHGSSFQKDITVQEVQKAALELISNVPIPSHSTFLAACLYYDLCTRLISNGHLIEALSVAKEAHSLCTKLFQVKFAYTVHQQAEEYDETGGFSQNLIYTVGTLKLKSSVTREVLLFDSKPWDLKDYYLSPWKILQCYLESTLQVGIVHEIIGNAAEAESFLLWGKSISYSLKLPLFMIAFSSILGRLYNQKRLWELAEKELQSALQILKESSMPFCCSKCKLILEVTVYQYLGDLCQSRFDTNAGDVSEMNAENLYSSALDKLNLSEWKNPLTCPEEGMDESVTDVKYDAGLTSFTVVDANVMNCTRERVETKTGAKQNRKTKNAAKVLPKEKSLVPESKPRLTRSRYQSSQNQDINKSDVPEVRPSKNPEGNHISDESDMHKQKDSVLKKTDSSVVSRCEITSYCNKMKCWHCLPHEVLKSGLLIDFIHLKWEFVRRQLSVRLLTRVVKCFAYPGQIDKVHRVLLRTVSVLISRNPFYPTFSSVPLDYFCHLVAKEIKGDIFAIERAEILHVICWFSLKSYHFKDTRNIFCNPSCIKFDDLASWLLLAFVLSREVPMLFQKVSRLLAVMYIASSSNEHFSLSSSGKILGENHWASYFHQASIGTHSTYQFLSNVSGRCKVRPPADAEGSYGTGSSCMRKDMSNLLRLVPETIRDVAEYVKKFLVGLPSTTVVSISLLGCDYASLLQELLLYPTHVHAWMLVSRLSSKSEPVVMLLPVDSILEASDDDDMKSGSGTRPECESSSKHWHCPWGYAVIDDVAPTFKMILEENYLSSSETLEDTKENRMLWWMRRKKLDSRFGKLLRKLEDSWFGSWKFLLLGEWLNCKKLDAVHKKLVCDIRSKCKLDVNEGLLKVILGSSKHDYEGESLNSQLCLKKGCYIAKVGYCDEARYGIFSNSANKFGKPSVVAFQLLDEALDVLEVEDSISREPIILVLDYEVQMLPWENLPILRNQDVYRMPSISSISAVLDRSSIHQEQVGKDSLLFPLIDPLDAFYLLNPSGDLSGTQIEFENYFRSQNLEGKAGSKPTVEELTAALKEHDLYIYFGHGSGAQYISRHNIQKLEKCAATLLMGCSSGSLTLHGSYAPQGTPLSYLLAGSPAIVANLWEVTDKDINRFGKAVLDAWLKERSSLLSDCSQCKLLSEEFEAMNLKGCKGKAKRKVSRKKLQEACESDSRENNCDHRPKIGSFMGEARKACTLPFLNGASPVCYGVPTGIWRKKNF